MLSNGLCYNSTARGMPFEISDPFALSHNIPRYLDRYQMSGMPGDKTQGPTTWAVLTSAPSLHEIPGVHRISGREKTSFWWRDILPGKSTIGGPQQMSSGFNSPSIVLVKH